MKVLILANNPGGLYKFRKELLEALLLNEHDVFISVPKGNFINELQQMGCHYIETNISRHGTNPFVDLALVLKYHFIIKNVKPDIVFTYTIKPNVYGGIACQINKIPYAANVTGLGSAVENGGPLQKITLALYKIGLKKAKKVFFQNQENLDFMVKHGVVRSAYALIPGSGVNLEHFSPMQYPLEDAGIHFLFLSRIMKEKGIEQYLDAAKRIKQKAPNVFFHVCGICESEYEGKLNEFVKSDIVIYHGLVRDVREIFKKIHCTIHPTFYPEGISNVLLESCACARPVITTDRSGCREVVEDGVNGFLVKQRDSEDLIHKIEDFIVLTYEQKMQMGLAGRAKVEREFDRKIVVDAYLKELEFVK